MTREQKIVSFGFLLCGVVGGLLFREIGQVVWLKMHWPEPQWLLAPYELIAAALGLLIFAVLFKNKTSSSYTYEVVEELEKVTWPKREETVASAGIVSVLLGICALLFFLCDALWGTLLSLLYR